MPTYCPIMSYRNPVTTEEGNNDWRPRECPGRGCQLWISAMACCSFKAIAFKLMDIDNRTGGRH